jgi:hypothetical protein
MSTHELREALESHATFEDTAALVRLGDVKRRVRVVRRRRRAAIAGAAAAVVLAGSGVAVLLPGHGSADRQFAGMTAPATMTSLGYTYTFDRMVEGDGKAIFTDNIEGPFLVSWADAGKGPITVIDPDSADSSHVSDGDFKDFLTVSGNQERSVRVTGRDRVAIAVYRLSGHPEGVTKDGVTFRQQTPNATLLKAGFNESGAQSVAFDVVAPDAPVRVVESCLSPRKAKFEILVDGEQVVSGDCNASTFDPIGAGFSEWDDMPTAREGSAKAGQSVHIEMRLLGNADPESSFGLGVYAADQARTTVAGRELDDVIEQAGHTWRLLASTAGPASGVPLDLEIPSDDVVPVVIGNTGNADQVVKVDLRLKGRQLNGDHVSAGQFSTTGEAITGESGSHLVLRLTARGRVGGTMGLAVYERID